MPASPRTATRCGSARRGSPGGCDDAGSAVPAGPSVAGRPGRAAGRPRPFHDPSGAGRPGPRDEALAIMRRSDVGPFGVAALLFTVLVQITALATVNPGWPGALAVLLAAVTGRVAVVLATGPGSPAARPDGFGALVAAATTARARVAAGAALLVVAAGTAAVVSGPVAALRAAAAVLAGLLAAGLLRRIAVRRLGGLTGDVFGALIEVAAATALLVLALASPG